MPLRLRRLGRWVWDGCIASRSIARSFGWLRVPGYLRAHWWPIARMIVLCHRGCRRGASAPYPNRDPDGLFAGQAWAKCRRCHFWARVDA